ncbi:hypothetical protein K492DRAFT_184320 [Lichtheimia hyalospora FSU 10163]|nr:hypothetical protein K492DRAFT_184320 [Lichtheimia hyalospora FSU 10163]
MFLYNTSCDICAALSQSNSPRSINTTIVNDENLIFIMKNMPCVTRLQLVGPSNLVTTENLVQLVQCHNIKNLSQLRFQNLYQVNDDVLDALSTIRLDTLISISLDHNLGITNAGVQRLVDGFKGRYQLRRLKINTIRRMHVSSNIIKYARTQLPHTFVTEENRGNLTPYI